MRLVVSAIVLTGLLVVPSLANANLTMADANPDGVKSLYVESTTPASTSSTTFTVMPGMQLTLPARNPKTKFALVTFNGAIVPGGFCFFGIYAGSTQYAVSFLSGNVIGPVTMVTKIPLLTVTQQLQVEWYVYLSSGSCNLGYTSPSITLPAFDSLTVILSAD